MSTEINLDKVAQHLLGCLQSNLLELLYKEDDDSEELTEENLPKLIKCIAMKSKNVWHQRRKLHKMMQDARIGENIHS